MWETSNFVNPNLFREEVEANLRERGFINADFSATLDSLRGTELPPMHLTNAVTWEFNDNDYFAQIM